MTDTLDKVIFLSLGWLLGLLGPIIVDAIRRRRQVKLLRAGLLTELQELQYRLALAAYYLKMHMGVMDRKFIEWLMPIVEGYKGSNPSENILNDIRSRLKLTDNEMNELSSVDKGTPGKAVVLCKFTVPLLDSVVTLLPIVDATFRNHLLEVKAHLNMLNEYVDEARFYFSLTFAKNTSSGNYDLAVENLNVCYQEYANRARLIVDRIALLFTNM